MSSEIHNDEGGGFGEEDWDMEFEELEFGDLVGKGNFGCVWKGEYIGNVYVAFVARCISYH